MLNLTSHLILSFLGSDKVFHIGRSTRFSLNRTAVDSVGVFGGEQFSFSFGDGFVTFGGEDPVPVLVAVGVAGAGRFFLGLRKSGLQILSLPSSRALLCMIWLRLSRRILSNSGRFIGSRRELSLRKVAASLLCCSHAEEMASIQARLVPSLQYKMSSSFWHIILNKPRPTIASTLKGKYFNGQHHTRSDKKGLQANYDPYLAVF
jgi:hypothetical protein